MGFELPMAAWIMGPLKDFSQTGMRQAVEQGVFFEQYARALYNSLTARKLHWTEAWAAVVLGWYLEKEDANIALA